MANPFLGTFPQSQPTYVTDHRGDTNNTGVHYHVAGLLLLALIVLTAMKISGFRAMVGIGRG